MALNTTLGSSWCTKISITFNFAIDHDGKWFWKLENFTFQLRNVNRKMIHFLLISEVWWGVKRELDNAWQSSRCAKKRKTTSYMDPWSNKQCTKKPGKYTGICAEQNWLEKTCALCHLTSRGRSRPHGQRWWCTSIKRNHLRTFPIPQC